MRAPRIIAATAAIPLMLLSAVGAAHADSIENTIGVDDVSTISPGGLATVGYRVQSQNFATDGQSGCNPADGSPLTVTIVKPVGVTVGGSTLQTGNKLVFTQCGQPQSVTFSAAAAGDYFITTTYSDSGPGGYTNSANWTLHVASANTAPVVSVTGVTDGTTYNKGAVPDASCSVTDSQDGPSSFAATLSAVTGTYASEGIGSQTASCSYTDADGLSDSDSVTYSIIDPSAPVISHALTPAAPDGVNGWYKSDVSLDWTVADNESPNSLQETGCGDQNITIDQIATDYSCSATSAGGSAPQQTVTIKRDATAPTNVSFSGGPADGVKYFPNSVPTVPTCTADDTTSGLDDCVVSGYSTALGTHTLTATATDNAGNVTVTTGATYTVRKLTLNGFFAPVDMGAVTNTVKAGSTVPLKFRVFDEGVEQTATTIVKGFSTKTVSCTSGTSEDAIEEFATTGGTSLRYDTTGSQFVQNWKTPTKAGTCYAVTMTTIDDSAVTALFKLK